MSLLKALTKAYQTLLQLREEAVIRRYEPATRHDCAC